jgi:hypothetical protein
MTYLKFFYLALMLILAGYGCFFIIIGARPFQIAGAGMALGALAGSALYGRWTALVASLILIALASSVSVAVVKEKYPEQWAAFSD